MTKELNCVSPPSFAKLWWRPFRWHKPLLSWGSLWHSLLWGLSVITSGQMLCLLANLSLNLTIPDILTSSVFKYVLVCLFGEERFTDKNWHQISKNKDGVSVPFIQPLNWQNEVVSALILWSVTLSQLPELGMLQPAEKAPYSSLLGLFLCGRSERFMSNISELFKKTPLCCHIVTFQTMNHKGWNSFWRTT